LARLVPYTDLVMIPEGMVVSTNMSTNWKPKLAVSVRRLPRKDKK
jgi:hypothetical protein